MRIVSVDGAWVVEELREEHGPTEVHTVKFELAGVNNSLAPCGDAVVRTGLAGDVLAKAGRGAPDDGAVPYACCEDYEKACVPPPPPPYPPYPPYQPPLCFDARAHISAVCLFVAAAMLAPSSGAPPVAAREEAEEVWEA